MELTISTLKNKFSGIPVDSYEMKTIAERIQTTLEELNGINVAFPVHLGRKTQIREIKEDAKNIIELICQEVQDNQGYPEQQEG